MARRRTLNIWSGTPTALAANHAGLKWETGRNVERWVKEFMRHLKDRFFSG
jgi:hypothetical protein